MPVYVRIFAVVLCLSMPLSFADGPADNNSESVRPIPPPGIEIANERAKALTERCRSVRAKWERTLAKAQTNVETAKQWQRAAKQQQFAATQSLTSEILVFPRAVELALELEQFYSERDFQSADELLAEAERRIQSAESNPAWSHVIGINEGRTRQLIVGGYQSKIDESYQPYAVVIPPGFSQGDSRPRRLDVWFHGRGEKLSEVNFLAGARRSSGQYAPADTLVLHPYGRYSNAFKFAGEVDVLEAIEHIQAQLPVDEKRISARGFSMGGAACWQFATHYPDRFFAANPGAGFSETPEFLKSFQGEDLSDTPSYQRKLWRLYDCPYWARNLVDCPTVAYSGEIDRQKQAADVMEVALAAHDIDLIHIIGPQTGHKIHPDSKVEIEDRMASLAAHVRTDVPSKIDFSTQTLRYHRSHWISVNGLQEHWMTARVQASLSENADGPLIQLDMSNVNRLRLQFDAGQWPLSYPAKPVIRIGDTKIVGSEIRSDLSWEFELVRNGKTWSESSDEGTSLRKKPGLQGPIDDAFLDSFLFVTPSGKANDVNLNAWLKTESKHAQSHWRKHFRGDIRTIRDQDVTKEHLANHNLVLFGDPDSNSLIARLESALPVSWTKDSIRCGKTEYPRSGHAVLMIYPNPLSPDRYVVLNSGFTFREYDYLNNARQTPKLPDWAIVDIREGATMRDPGRVVSAGFFDETWKFKNENK